MELVQGGQKGPYTPLDDHSATHPCSHANLHTLQFIQHYKWEVQAMRFLGLEGFA